MSFSLSARKLAVCWCSLVAMPVAVLAQNPFVPTAGEYSVTGKLPGDQVHPAVSITPNGGYIAWEDYWVDNKGLGVGAMRLNSDLTGSGVPFRVNSVVAGDQEAAHVANLNNGGAVFAWQGGKQGSQHIFARFLSSSNSWLTGDVMVNSSSNKVQVTPVVTTLANGNVALAYASADQAAPGSMLDVYLQLFSPVGVKIGGEILVNQFTVNNQRSPAIAPLADGKFVLAWVSEQERWTDASNGVPSVDIFARVYDSVGNPVTSEFLVNVSPKLCAAPDVAASPDGGFMATWMDKDPVVRNNGWDIAARRFSSAWVGGAVTRVNTQLFGDQYSPKIRRSGSTYLDIWTSLGQDTSGEGVFGRYLNDDATTSGSEFQNNSTTFRSQMHQVLAADDGRFLAAWTSFGVGVTGFDLFAQQYANPAAATIGTNDPVFATDPNANPNSVSNAPVTTVVINPPGNPNPTSGGPTLVTNTFSDVKGTYNGLIFDPNGVAPADSGYATIATSAKGAQGSFTAKLQIGGKAYSVSGPFDATGNFTGKIGTWNISLLIDLHGGDRITGQISSSTWTVSLQADRAVYGKTNQTALAGSYTLLVQPGDGSMGTGVGTATIDTLGNVKWNLILPDGTKVGQSTTLSKSGTWPLYGNLYKNGGLVLGWMSFGTNHNDGFGGQSVWIKPGGASTVYPQGLSKGVDINGSSYQAPPILFRTFGNSKVIFSGGGLTSPITNLVTWGLDNKVVVTQSANALKMTVSPTTGLFQGTVALSAGKGGTVPFQGVLFEKENVGLGFFLGSSQSGAVTFAPNN